MVLLKTLCTACSVVQGSSPVARRRRVVIGAERLVARVAVVAMVTLSVAKADRRRFLQAIILIMVPGADILVSDAR